MHCPRKGADGITRREALKIELEKDGIGGPQRGTEFAARVSVFASPLAAAFRRAWPNAHIAWLVQPESAPLLSDHPALDEVIIWPRSRWQELWRQGRLFALLREIRTLRTDLRRRDFSLVVDLQGLLKSGLLARLSGARRRIGLGSREGSQWLMSEVLPRGGEAGLIGSEYRYLAERLRLPVDDFRMHIGIGEASQAQVQQLQLTVGSAYAVLCPFTTRPQKHWFVAHWRALIPQLSDALGMAVSADDRGQPSPAPGILDQ